MNNKWWLLGMLLAMSLIGTSLGVVYFRFVSLPHPNEASANQLIYWVVLRDLSETDQDIQLALVDRFAADATEIFSTTGGDVSLSQAQSQRLLANIAILKQVWFTSRVKEYSGIENPQTREVYLEKQIALLDEFGMIAFENARILYPDKDPETLTTISDELLADVDQWLADTPETRQAMTLQCVREATVCWLANQDLAIQVMDARKALVERVIAELENGMDLQQTTCIVTDGSAVRLRQNAVLLMEAWVHLLSDEYAELDRRERPKFIDKKLDQIESWKLLEYMAGDTAESSGISGLRQLDTIFTQWIDRAKPEQRERLNNLYAGLKQRLFFRLFEK